MSLWEVFGITPLSFEELQLVLRTAEAAELEQPAKKTPSVSKSPKPPSLTSPESTESPPWIWILCQNCTSRSTPNLPLLP